MNTLKKRLASLAVISVLALAGCAPAQSPATSPTPEPEASGEGTVKLNIGITQIVEHPSLDQIRQGIIDGLKESGYADGEQIDIDFQNAQGNIENTQLIAQKFESDKKDMVIAITTPSAQAAKNVVKSCPVIFSAVTDPEGAGVLGENITGVSDMTPITKQLELLKTLVPGAKTVGMIYNTGEQNSVVQVEMAKAKAAQMGLSIEAIAITNANEIPLALDTLLGKVDVLYTHIDNTIASAYGVIVEKANAKQIPIIGAVEDYVNQGALATEGINNYTVGVQTGKMAARVLKGEAIADIPFETLKETELIVNTEAAKLFEITLSEEMKAKAKMVGGK